MAFATTEDVATHLGRDLTTAEEALAEDALDLVADLIRDAVSKSTSWTPSPVPSALKALSIQKAKAAVVNPSGIANDSESLGAYSYARTFPRNAGSGLFLTDAEARQARFAVHGTNRATVMLGSTFEEVE